ncbi:hypothetical protein PSTT_05121, partial [Puccinia striiformis]
TVSPAEQLCSGSALEWVTRFLDAGTPTGQTPVKEIDFLSKVGSGRDDLLLSPGSSTITPPQTLKTFWYQSCLLTDPQTLMGKPVQSGEARNLLSTSHSLGTRRVIGETSASQVGLPLPKKMRIDMPPSTRQFLSQPVTDCNNPPTRQGTMTAIGTIPKTVDYTVLRLEFSYGVLVTQNSEDRNSLVEDQDFSQMEDFIIKKSRFNDAFTMFAECLGTFKEQSALDLKYKYPGRSPREVYLFTCFNECWKNSAGWFTYWRITQDIMSMCKSKDYSYFTCPIITNPAHGDTELTIIEDDFKPRSRQAPLRDMSASYKTLLWRWLKVWILNSGRDYLRINFFYNHYSNQAFLSFFNKLFCLSIKGNNRRLLESSAAIIHVSS